MVVEIKDDSISNDTTHTSIETELSLPDPQQGVKILVYNSSLSQSNPSTSGSSEERILSLVSSSLPSILDDVEVSVGEKSASWSQEAQRPL